MTPRPLNVPSNNPILAKQREHSTCIQPLTTLQYPKSRTRLKQPSTHTDIPPPCGHASEIRPLIPRIFRRRSGKSASGVSESMSSRNTSFEISRDVSIEDFTPSVPYVDLQVFASHESVDYYTSADIWVCIEATVRAKTWFDGGDNIVIPSLRFCYKPVEGCEVLEFVGERSVKDLKAGQASQLFLRVQLPKLKDPERSGSNQWSQEELYEHLESMLGVHEMECLQVEVKYRYPHIPSDNVMTVKHLCRIKRPKKDNTWSMCASRGGVDCTEHDQAVDVHNKLARLRATQQTQSPTSQSPRTYVSQPEVIISHVDVGSGDTARQLWQDLKRSSLSTQQLIEMSPERVEQLAASDASLKARRQQALANKRSVGAETLKGWKWEAKANGQEAETPWL